MILNPKETGPQAAALNLGLHKRIVGQDEALREIVSVHQTWLAKLHAPHRPIANFLFLGPTGTGKTRVVEALAETLVGDASAVIKIDCGEFQHSHEIAKLIGSPPGYLGHRETHPLLSQEVLNAVHTEKCRISFVLFDEIEKASDALWNLLLGILDKATLTLGNNERVDFSHAMIFMTSNLGSREMHDLAGFQLGFSGVKALVPDAGKLEKTHLLSEGTDPKYGARHLKRAIEKALVHPMANLIASEQIRAGDELRVDCEEGEMVFQRIGEGLPVYAMVRAAGIDMPEDDPALSEYAAAGTKAA